MRRLNTAYLITAAGLLLTGAGCKREQRAVEKATIEEQPELMAVVQVADPKATFQLLKGFYALEGNAWRWTAKNFSVLLRAPAGAGEKGAMLRLKLNVPDPIVAKLGPVSLSAEAGGVTLAPETFRQAGDYEYVRDVPAGAFKAESLTVNFSLDKALPPGDVDRRELGIIVTMVGLEPK